jgi:predicted nucleic acid-binding protein
MVLRLQVCARTPGVTRSTWQSVHHDALVAFARSLERGELLVEPVLDPDWPRIAELTEQYEDLPLGIVDATVIALAERRQLDTIATLDHRRFATVKPRHIDAFTLVP